MADVKLNFLHVCENAFVSQDGKLSIIGIFNQIKASNFPAAHPKLSIVSSISGVADDYLEVIEIVSPKAEVIARIENNVKIQKEGGAANLIASFVNLIFLIGGKYTIRIKVNNELLSEDNFILLGN
ncbi:MAG: hypothetical protein ACD_11C00108G0036 [uncultured bacterium]|nr:MAG: hypothetical protein ACD_11C00108G0036 [uncultured bacterium]HBR71442.1 hypothetical protein [Candidatus Moranbacteria bacterium]